MDVVVGEEWGAAARANTAAPPAAANTIVAPAAASFELDMHPGWEHELRDL